MNPITKEFLKEIKNLLSDKQQYCEIWEEFNCVKVQIIWGDWKHNHLYVKYLMEKYFNMEERNSIVTEENGSDCYSAIHVFSPIK